MGSVWCSNGVNRHEWNPEKGRAIDADDMNAAMAVLKANNINACAPAITRTRAGGDLSDKNGIYMIDETNLESHGSWQKPGRDRTQLECAGQPAGMERLWWTVPAACWSAQKPRRCADLVPATKSYAGEDILAMTHFFHAKDPSRLVHYEGVVHNRAFAAITDWKAEYAAVGNPGNIWNQAGKPFILSEYMHDMGNSLAAWKAM